MNLNRLLLTVCAALLAGQINCTAQQPLYRIAFSGSCATTDSSGHIVSHPINNRTLLQDFGALHSTPTSGLGLAYHFGGNELGDTIDVINRTNGATIYTLFGLYFGESFGRMELPSSSGRQIKRLEYVYTDQNSHSLGSALLTTYYWFNTDGSTNRAAVLGNMQYLILPNNLHTNVQVCTGFFEALQPWQFP